MSLARDVMNTLKQIRDGTQHEVHPSPALEGQHDERKRITGVEVVNLDTLA